MKSWALLKDSLREVVDGKVFYVLLGISLVVILFLASVGYRFQSAEDEAKSYVEFWNWYDKLFSPGQPEPSLKVEITDWKQTVEAPASEPWRGAYSFRWVIHCRDERLADQVRDASQRWFTMRPRQQRDEVDLLYLMFYKYFHWLKGLERNLVKSELGKPDDPKTVVFEVKSTGTNVISRRGWIHEVTLFFGFVPVSVWHEPISHEVTVFMDYLVGTVGASVAMLIGTIVTASFIPNMLRKGTVDLLLSKPVHRSALLLYKYLGGLAFLFLNALMVVGGVWLVLGLRSGIWSLGFLLTVFVLTFQFAVYYACSTLFGVLTRSPFVAILMTCLLWLVLFLVGWANGVFHPKTEDNGPSTAPQWAVQGVDALHAALPRMDDLNALRSELIASDTTAPEDPEPTHSEWSRWAWAVGTSLAFIVVLLGLACWVFSRRDY
jgi:hypothetical protein